MLKISHLFGPKTKKSELSSTEATVLFSDIVNFTRISTEHTPEEIVAALESLFAMFDVRAKREKIAKVKTIGDSYMAAISEPKNKGSQIYRMAKFATGLYEDLDAYNEISPIKLHMRIGINTGDVVASMDNAENFIYDLWGDTVNVAHRMEHAGTRGDITVSESVKKAARSKGLIFENPRTRNIKGKGEMKIYTVRLKN